jgi:hypothetical protein
VLELPTDRPRSARQSNRGAHCFRKVEPAVVAAVRRVGRQQGAGLYAVLLCAWQALLARYSGQRDLVVGSPVARRQQPELEPVIGFLVNTVPLRTRWPGNPTLGEALAAVQDTVLRVLALAAVPFERLVQELNPQRSLLHNPIFQVGLALEHWEADRFSLPGVTVEPLRLETGVSRFELMLWLTQTPDGWAISSTCCGTSATTWPRRFRGWICCRPRSGGSWSNGMARPGITRLGGACTNWSGRRWKARPGRWR